MREVDPVSLDWIDPGERDAVSAMTAYFAELERRFEHGFDPGDALVEGLDDLRPPTGAFVIARCADAVAGCGGIRSIEPGVAEVKRMWVDPHRRGRRIGSRILAALEEYALANDHHTVRLDTERVLVEAVAMYRRAGYREIGRYNDNPYPDLFFEKQLGA